MVYHDLQRHLVADSLDELHLFAESIGIKRCWFDADRAGGKPHYDIPQFVIRGRMASLALTRLVSSREILTISKQLGRSRGLAR